jgi:hypothetical protein
MPTIPRPALSALALLLLAPACADLADADAALADEATDTWPIAPGLTYRMRHLSDLRELGLSRFTRGEPSEGTDMFELTWRAGGDRDLPGLGELAVVGDQPVLRIYDERGQRRVREFGYRWEDGYVQLAVVGREAWALLVYAVPDVLFERVGGLLSSGLNLELSLRDVTPGAWVDVECEREGRSSSEYVADLLSTSTIFSCDIVRAEDPAVTGDESEAARTWHGLVRLEIRDDSGPYVHRGNDAVAFTFHRLGPDKRPIESLPAMFDLYDDAPTSRRIKIGEGGSMITLERTCGWNTGCG